MILLLEKLNKALQTIAPPLPPGYDYASAVRREAADAVPNRTSSRPGLIESEASLDTAPAARHRPFDNVDSYDNQQNLCSLWNACCGAFTIMSTYAGSNHLTADKSGDRLRLWGVGLFEGGELHLDILLRASRSLQEKLWEPLVSRFVEIALQQRKCLYSI